VESVLITGANRGIGLELTKRYAAAGNRVFACCRDPDKAVELQALTDTRKGLSIHGVQITEAASVTGLIKQIRAAPIDILINNAGTSGPPPQRQSLQNMDFDAWAETFSVNTMAPLRMLQAFRDNLKAGTNPRAVTMTSQMGALAWKAPGMYAYCSSKAAVNKVMQMAAIELANDGIAVCLIHPGWVRTDSGGTNADLSVAKSAYGIMAVIDKMSVATTGRFLKWNGEEHPW